MSILGRIFQPGIKMPERLLAGQIEWLHIWLAALTAMWGGLVSYFRQILAGDQHSWTKVFIHLSMSGFAGLLCLLGCLHFNVPVYLTGILSGLAGHMGAEFIKILETRFRQRLRAVGTASHTGRRATDTDPNAAPTGLNLGRRADDVMK